MTRKKGRAPTRRPAAKRRGGPRFDRRSIWLSLGAGLALLLILSVWFYAGPGPLARDGHATTVVLPPGAHVTQIADSLAEQGVIRWPLGFVIAARLTGAAPRLKAGEYAFPSGAPMWRVLAAIRDGAVVRRFVTVPEGATSKMVADILLHASVLRGEPPAPPEGSILPETYQIERGEERTAVLARMTAARDRLVAQLWRARAPDLPFQTPEQAVILASIVEKETAKPDERARIAGLFVNRLRIGMRLESDPTVIYGLTGGEPLGHGLRRSELEAPTPYNTYRLAGLPPTPIANPGRATLAAVMTPARTGDLYFVADGTGGHVFSATLAEHLRHVAQWRLIEKARSGATAP